MCVDAILQKMAPDPGANLRLHQAALLQDVATDWRAVRPNGRTRRCGLGWLAMDGVMSPEQPGRRRRLNGDSRHRRGGVILANWG